MAPIRESERLRIRLERARSPSATGREQPAQGTEGQEVRPNAIVDCGWGRLIFAQTFADNQALVNILRNEAPNRRDIGMYVHDPHVVVSLAPQELFLDPSHTFRLWLDLYQSARERPKGFSVRLLNRQEDAEGVHRLYVRRHMVPPEVDFILENSTSKILTYLVATNADDQRVIGAVTGIDHAEAFEDPENGASLWALAVDPQANLPGIGESLVRHLAEYYQAHGKTYLDLSVLHDNAQAIGLYEKLGFERVPVFAVKRKNPYNEPLFIGATPEDELNPYAKIIIREAHKRGIYVKVLDPVAAFFELSFGGRSIVCRESLSELTSAVAMSRCDDKSITHRVLGNAGINVPAQTKVTSDAQAQRFLIKHGSLVVKPARGEQGAGISVDVRTPVALFEAIAEARTLCETVLLEEYVEGQDLRIIVIDEKVVAAAIRRPPEVNGTGRDNVETLIRKQSRRREAATDGESRIPLDRETERCVKESGYAYDQVLPKGETLAVRKTANLHTGGTIHDVTDLLHPALRQAAVDAARALDIPVTGLDFIVPSVGGPQFVVIEANERPGLANHEPQPTAERFIDLLFPQTALR